MALTRSEMERLVGPVDNQLAAEIVRTDATADELARAMAWIHADEALVNDGQHLPSGRVAELVALLAPPEDDDEPRAADDFEQY